MRQATHYAPRQMTPVLNGRRPHARVLLLVMSLGLVSASTYAPGGQAADSQVINFSITVVQGSCTVDAPSVLALDTVDGRDLVGKNWERAALKPLTVNLTQCSGSPAASTSPTLTLKADAVRAGTNNKVFYTAAGTAAKGFGVVIYKSAAPATGETDAVADGGVAWQGAKNSALNSDTSIPLAAAVACGPSAACGGGNLGAGALSAHVTFTFAYK